MTAPVRLRMVSSLFRDLPDHLDVKRQCMRPTEPTPDYIDIIVNDDVVPVIAIPKDVKHQADQIVSVIAAVLEKLGHTVVRPPKGKVEVPRPGVQTPYQQAMTHAKHGEAMLDVWRPEDFADPSEVS